MENTDEEGGHQIPRQGANGHQDNANRTIPPLDFPNGLRGMRLLDDVDDVGAANGPAPQQKQHHRHIGGKGQGQEIGLRVKGEGHLLGIHQEKAEQLPDPPGQRAA